RAIDENDLSEVRIMQREYWAALNKVFDSIGGAISGNKKPQPQAWMSFPIGRSRFHLNATMVRPKSQIRADLYIGGPHAKRYFKLLEKQTEEIERELGYALDWEELPDGQDSRVSC